jgi:DNA-binding NtrC family response regulator
MKTRVLFVDDDSNLLNGLQRALRTMHRQWDMHFASCGVDGLALMKQSPFDVVVSDLRMPEMDGSEFLFQVSQRHPQSVRIILSGSADHELKMAAAAVAHRVLPKPCEAAELIANINSALEAKAVQDTGKVCSQQLT